MTDVADSSTTTTDAGSSVDAVDCESSDTSFALTEAEVLQAMEAFKAEGNLFFKAKDFSCGVESYTSAIDLFNVFSKVTPKVAASVRKLAGACLNNRGMCYFKLELFRATIDDSKAAIKCKFFKGYYRRGCAYAAMGKWAKAKKDFASARKHFPKSKDIKSKLKQATEAHTYQKFSKAIAMEHMKPFSETMRADKYPQPSASYKGPRLESVEEIDEAWVESLIEFYKDGGKLPLRIAAQIMMESLRIFQSYPNVVSYDLPQDAAGDGDSKSDATSEQKSFASVSDLREMEEGEEKHAMEEQKRLLSSAATRVTVCGDVHGQYFDFLNIFEMNGLPSVHNPYLFNGDFVDRGSWSVEIIMVMLCYKCALGEHFMMTRGNHEAVNMNVMYGFKGEVEAKLNKELFELFTELFNALPLAYILGKKVFVCHGGLFQQDKVTIAKLQSIDRHCQPSEGNTNEAQLAEIMSDLLWSDPQPVNGRAPSKRGGGTMFGPDITEAFLELNNLELLIRSHEVQKDGYLVQHNEKLITIFSAPNYVDSMGNKGAFITLDRDYKPSFTQFEAVPHPDVKPMAYARGPMSFMNFM